jgi:Protein of unknown function (DUF1036)
MGASDIRFTNSYGQPMSVAYMRLDYNCGNECGDPWDVLGWVDLNPGDTQTRPNPTSNRYFYYYGEAVDGAFWTGPYPAEVTQARFEKCTCLGVIQQNGEPTNPYQTVGFRELDTDTFGGVNFIP